MLNLFNRIIVCFLALSIFWWASEAQANTSSLMAARATVYVGSGGDKFCDVPIVDNLDIENRFSKSLAIDPTGHRKMEGCNAAPIDFLSVWEKTDPKANLTSVADLPAYAHSMVATQAQKGYHYDSAYLWRQPGGGYLVKLTGHAREIRKGEVIFMSRTSTLVMMSNCANPGVIEIPPDVVVTAKPCIPVEFPSFKGRATRVVFIGRKMLPTECIKLEEAGVAEPFYFEALPQDCPLSYDYTLKDEATGALMVYRVSCNWQRVERAASELLGYTATVQNLSTSFYGKADGTNVVYVPEEALDGEVVVCYDDNDKASFGVRRRDYVNGKMVIPLSVVLAHQ